MRHARFRSGIALVLILGSCNGKDQTPPDLDVDSWAKGCYAVRSGKHWLRATPSGKSYDFSGEDSKQATRFFMQPSDLGTYLFYDEDRGYLVGAGQTLKRETSLESDVTLIDDDFVSGAEWVLETSVNEWTEYQLLNRKNGRLLSDEGLTDEDKHAVSVVFEPATGCVEHPEMSLDATGTVGKTTFDDGDLYGIVDAHSHILSNFGFGGGLFHGGAFHRLGVEHALPDCELYHGVMGRKDFFGYAYDAGNNSADLGAIIPDLAAGALSVDNHDTRGYPEFTEWPNARKRSTHQTQYYRWLQRAHLAGLRLVVQHATSNSVICSISVGEGYQPSRYDCEDMTAVDRIIDETYQMERYIDAQSGGPGKGWFRVVGTPAEAREVITQGKMAVVLGIETSDLFRCHITPRPDGPVCDEAYVLSQLELYHEKGVRALFPVHKYDNAFTPGDGSSDFIEVGNFLNSGHWTNMTEDCPSTNGELPGGSDDGPLSFGGLLEPRDDFLAPAPNDLSDLPNNPLQTIAPYILKITEPGIEGNWCQAASLTPLGEKLIWEMMKRGMILEVDHFPQRSYMRAFELLEEHQYPAVGTHGRHWNGKLYELGGLSTTSLGRCHDAENPGSSLHRLQDKIALIAEKGGYPAEGFGFDLNGFAGGPRPRFGDDGCGDDQQNPVTYPFDAYAGDVSFTEPYLGNRAVDFNTEGMIHIGLLPELLQDARLDAVSDGDLEPLFRSAEAYVRMWELAEARGEVLSGQ